MLHSKEKQDCSRRFSNLPKAMYTNINFRGVASLLLATTMIIGCSCSSSKIQTDMSARQKILKSFYPTLTKVTRFFGVKTNVKLPGKKVDAPVSLFDLNFESIDGGITSIKN